MKKIVLPLLLISTACLAQQRDSLFIRKIADEVLQHGKAYDQLRVLTKSIGARLSGSAGYNKAVIWGRQTLQSVGADTVYLQECLVPHWIRGTGDKVSVVQVNGKATTQPLDALALGNSLGNFNPLTAAVISIKDFADLEQQKASVKGKIVYYNAAFDATDINPFQSYRETGIYRRAGASMAAKYGAKGIIIRSLTSTYNFPHTGNMQYNDSFPKIPAVAIGYADADRLQQLLEKGRVSVSLLTHGKQLPDTIAHNVIAELKGTAHPEQYITVGGHLDSWDVCEGAHDDGTGVVQTIEILRVFKALGYQPKHTIRFVLFANEENGTRGGEKYAASAKTNNEHHLFALESDAGGFTPRGFGFTLSADQLQKIQTWLPLLQPYGTSLLQMGGGGSDIQPLNKSLSVPLGGFLPDPQRYFDIHHARNDVFENVNKRELLLGAVNMAALLYLVDQYGL